jgi:hypothetical protein
MASAFATDKGRAGGETSRGRPFSATLGVAVTARADVSAENLQDKRIAILQGNLGVNGVPNTLKPSV